MNDVLCFRLFQALGLADGSCPSLLASRVRESGRHSPSVTISVRRLLEKD